MDFNFTEAQINLRKKIIHFANEELNTGAADRDRRQIFSRELWLKCAGAGLMGLPVPAEYGGRGLDSLSTALALEALGYGCADGGLVFSIGAHLFSCVVPLWKYGSEEQKRRLLPGLCGGALVGANASSEADAGSDIFSMTTRAEPDGEGFRIHGKKMFVSNGPVADVMVVCAATDPQKGAQGGISAFLVEKGAPGCRPGPNIEKMGLRTSPLGEVEFDNVFAPASSLLGKTGAGGTIFARFMEWERIGLFAAHIGTMERLLETSVGRARTRRQFGQPLGKFQAVSHRIADMKTRLEAARLLIYRAAWMLDQGGNISLEASMVKLFAGESFVKAALDTIQVLGGYGYLTEYEVERTVRDSVAATIYSGTSEMQRNIIARWLGL